MNLAIEYILRSGELKANLFFPYSLFLDNASSKIVITIHKSATDIVNNTLTIRNWSISTYSANDRVPIFTNHKISKDDLFTSDLTVVPGFDLLWYTQDPYFTDPRSSSIKDNNKRYALGNPAPKLGSGTRSSIISMCTNYDMQPGDKKN